MYNQKYVKKNWYQNLIEYVKSIYIIYIYICTYNVCIYVYYYIENLNFSLLLSITTLFINIFV